MNPSGLDTGYNGAVAVSRALAPNDTNRHIFLCRFVSFGDKTRGPGVTTGRLAALGDGRGEAARRGGLLDDGGRDHLRLLLRHGHGHHGDSGADGHAHADETAEGDEGESGVDVLGGRHRALVWCLFLSSDAAGWKLVSQLEQTDGRED